VCGIAGIINLADTDFDVDAGIETLTRNVLHRGPDSRGIWRNGSHRVALGHTRLSILDVSDHASQPMVSADNRFVIVYNGEVYNFLEIAAELKGRGYVFRSESDTEVVLAAYQEWGVNGFHRFNGMWAIAIYDTNEERLILSRDRFGIKPLYCYRDKSLFIFASEVQAIHRTIPDRVSPNWDYLSGLMKFDTSIYGGSATHVRGIETLQPGCIYSLRDGQFQCSRWYWLERVDVPVRYEDQVQRFRELLVDACRLRLRSDVPVATCLSGGIDSGSIVSILSQFSDPESERFQHFTHTAFTAGFPDTELDEAAAARALSIEKGIRFDLNVMSAPTAEEMELGLDACDGPMPAFSFFPIWRLYRHIKSRGISVTLDGQGADEMLGGYYIGYAAVRGAFQMGRLSYARDLYQTYKHLHVDAAKWINYDFQCLKRDLATQVLQQAKRPLKACLAKVGLYRQQPDLQRRSPGVPVAIGNTFGDRSNWLYATLWHQFFVSPLPFLLYQYDRCSMASGVECRMPFMDFRLVQYIYSLPIEARLGCGFTKRILRDAVCGALPDHIRLNRTKTGFNAPFARWMNGPLRTWVLDTMDTAEFRSLPHTNVSELRSQVEGGSLTSESEKKLWPRIHTADWLRRSRSF
jgi:asparagine synthase (glutamine-hydrolysing)